MNFVLRCAAMEFVGHNLRHHDITRKAVPCSKSDTDIAVCDHATDFPIHRYDWEAPAACIPHQLGCAAQIGVWQAVTRFACH